MKLANVRLIVIHCADTPPSMDIGVKEIRRWHVDERKWSDIGYHFVIRRDSTLETGRPLSRQGAHVIGHNPNSIGICLVGGKGGNSDDHFSTHYTPMQEQTLIKLLRTLKSDIHSLSRELLFTIHVAGHNEFANRSCPCFNVEEWLDTPTTTTSDSGLTERTDSEWIYTTLESAPGKIMEAQRIIAEVQTSIDLVIEKLEHNQRE